MSWEIHAENDTSSSMFNMNATILLQLKLHHSVKHNSTTEQTQSAVKGLMKSLQFNQLHGEEQKMLSEYFVFGFGPKLIVIRVGLRIRFKIWKI